MRAAAGGRDFGVMRTYEDGWERAGDEKRGSSWQERITAG